MYLPDFHLQTHILPDRRARPNFPSICAHTYTHPLPVKAPLPVWPCTPPTAQMVPPLPSRQPHRHHHSQTYVDPPELAASSSYRTETHTLSPLRCLNSVTPTQRQKTREQQACSWKGLPGLGTEKTGPQLPGLYMHPQPRHQQGQDSTPGCTLYPHTHTCTHKTPGQQPTLQKNFTLPQTDMRT